MNKYHRPFFIILAVAIFFVLAWYFRYIVACGLIALVLTFIGQPLVQLLTKIRYKKFYINNSFAATITLLVIILVIAGLFREVVPLLISQATALSSINIDNILEYYEEPISSLTDSLSGIGIIDDNETLQTFLGKKSMDVLQKMNYNQIISEIFSFTWNFVLGVFTVLFFTFFMLKENGLIRRLIDSITPNDYLDEVHHIEKNSKRLISRYFIGLCVEVIFLTSILTICFTVFGFPNALLIAFCCGCMVIIPYLGVIIGGGLGLIILLATMISTDPTINVVPVILQYVMAFAVVKIIDDFVIQPLIYSRSVKAHPMEIFIVIMAAGKIGGIVGMILAVPMYTLIRIIAKEFFNSSKFVQSLTKNL